MSTLARQQQVLINALLAWPAEDAIKEVAVYAMDSGARGLKAYQANGHALARRALQAAYPVVAQTLGEESFSDLACALWHAQPPVRGDVACWGSGLAGFVQSSSQLQDEPYLSDVARAEWALHQCASAPDVAPDLSTLALLTAQDPAHLIFILAPGCALLNSAWPLASLLGAHLHDTPSFATLRQQLSDSVAQDVVVWRAGLRPMVREAAAGEMDFLRALMQGQSVAQALDESSILAFQTWLPAAIQSGLVLGVTQLPQ